MGNRYVTSTITRLTKIVSRQGFGMPLILGISKDHEYKEYAELKEVLVDFAVDSTEYKQAAALFSGKPKRDKIAIHSIVWDETTGDPTDLAAELDELVLKHNEWYFLHVATQKDDALITLSVWMEKQNKLFFASTSNAVLATTLNAERSVLMVHDLPESFPSEAWVGYGSAQDPGSFTWTFKTLNGIIPANYTGPEIDAIHAANGNTYIREGGVNITSGGKTTSGEYIDIIMGSDYLDSKIVEGIFDLLATTKKVPFTDAGIAMVVARLESALKDAANKDIIAKDDAGKPIYTVAVPKAADIHRNDKIKRILPGVSWSATLSGAIENVDTIGELAI